jgi:hypothetical protein
MGTSSSNRRKPNTAIPSYTPAGGGTPGISRPGIPPTTGIGNASPINANQQRDLMQANQMIANLTQQVNALQRNASGGVNIPQVPYGGYPYSGGTPPQMGYGTPPMSGQYPAYSPPSPQFQHLGGQSPYPYQQPMMGGGGGGGGGYRDTDFAAIANIAGLNPADVALLHREFMAITRSGTNKMDRVAFRQILRDVLLQANDEHVDRVIENMFVTIDRNHDGFIDFPEFIGAFKDVLKQRPSDPQSYFQDHVYPDIMTQQLRASGVGSGIASQPITYIQHSQPATQLVSTGGLSIVPLASTAIQQAPVVYGAVSPLQFSDATAPLITLDQSQSTYVIATPGQYMITQPTALQCVPLPMM